MLSHAFWQQQFSANPAVLGQTVLLDEVPHTIVGVLPRERGTGFFRGADVFTPFALDALRAPRDRRDVFVTGRLKTGVTRDRPTPSSRGSRVNWAASIRHERTIGAAVLPLIEASGFNVRILVTILGLIGLLIVVVACANVASVTVAQSLARRHELAVHAALGATRGNRIRRLLIESLFVSAARERRRTARRSLGHGWSAMAGQHALRFCRPADERTRARCESAHCAATPIGFGLLPALRMAPPDPQELRDGHARPALPAAAGVCAT